MGILLIGLNHRTAPVEVREQLAFSRDGAATALLLFRNQFPDSEAAILSTCNRVEILVAGEGDRPNVPDVVSFLAQARDLPVPQFRHHLYEFTGEQAIRHLFRVASGLDSMVLGEYQIVNQVKQAYAQASEQGTTGRLLNGLFHHAFTVGKRIRSETTVGERKLSVPSVAVEVAKQIFSDFRDKGVLVVGAGEMAQMTCQYLRQADARNFTVTTRTLANAKALAEACAGLAVPFNELDDQMARADIVIMATSCPVPFMTRQRVAAVQHRRAGRPLLIVDLAVPRNVESAVGELRDVFLYDIDSLGRIVEENRRYRLDQVDHCEKILDEELGAFEQWLAEFRITPLISQMYADARALRENELERFTRRCGNLTDDQRRQVEQLLDRVIDKFMHPCISTLRHHHQSPHTSTLVDSFHKLTAKLKRA